MPKDVANWAALARLGQPTNEKPVATGHDELPQARSPRAAHRHKVRGPKSIHLRKAAETKPAAKPAEARSTSKTPTATKTSKASSDTTSRSKVRTVQRLGSRGNKVSMSKVKTIKIIPGQRKSKKGRSEAENPEEEDQA